MSLYIDPDVWDITFVEGQLRMTASPVERALQGCRAKLQFWRGEWFLDTRQGIPYIDQVFVKGPNLAALESLFRRVLLSVPEVVSVPVLVLSLDRPTRRLSMDWEILVGDQIITSADYGPFVLG